MEYSSVQICHLWHHGSQQEALRPNQPTIDSLTSLSIHFLSHGLRELTLINMLLRQ